MTNKQFLDEVKPLLPSADFLWTMPEANSFHDGTNQSNEVGVWRLSNQRTILQKVMLTSKKYHQRRKALTEMVSAWLDEGLGQVGRVVPDTYAETFEMTDSYQAIWGEQPREPGRVRVCQVTHNYLRGVPGDEWRGAIYKMIGDLPAADEHCRKTIETSPDAERIALLDFLTINQDRSARNWLTDDGSRFYAIDNGMAWFHEYPLSEGWKIGCVIDNVLLQREPWKFISGVFTTSYAGQRLYSLLAEQLSGFNWPNFCNMIDLSCEWLGLPPLSEDWRFLGMRRRLEWIADKGRFPTATEYRGWLNDGSPMMTPPEIIATGGKLIWKDVEDRP